MPGAYGGRLPARTAVADACPAHRDRHGHAHAHHDHHLVPSHAHAHTRAHTVDRTHPGYQPGLRARAFQRPFYE